MNCLFLSAKIRDSVQGKTTISAESVQMAGISCSVTFAPGLSTKVNTIILISCYNNIFSSQNIFIAECVGLTSVPRGDWYCQYCQNSHQKEKFSGHNENAIAAGRIAGVDPIQQIIQRCIRIVKSPESDIGGCVLCRSGENILN